MIIFFFSSSPSQAERTLCHKIQTFHYWECGSLKKKKFIFIFSELGRKPLVHGFTRMQISYAAAEKGT